MAFDIRGAFDRVWWRGLLAHLYSIGIKGKAFALQKAIFQIAISLLSPAVKSQNSTKSTPLFPKGEYGHRCFTTCSSADCLKKFNMQLFSAMLMMSLM